MVPESPVESTEHGLVPKEDGWFVLNAREARWWHAPGRSAVCDFEGEPGFSQLGINLSVLGPGEPMAMYHWEADQEDFLVLAGEALLIVEGEERSLGQWDFVHNQQRLTGEHEKVLLIGGEALLIVEGEERSLGQWDFVHCPAGTKHVIVGAGDAPCVVLAVGARVRSTGPEWGGYSVNEAALRHGAGVEQETTDPLEA